MEDVEENPQAETNEVSTPAIEASINSLDDNSIVEPGTELAKSTDASDSQSVAQDESMPLDTVHEPEQSHQEAVALEDIVDRQHDDLEAVALEDQPQTKATDAAFSALGAGIPPTAPKKNVENRGVIDTKAPFESVKEAVSMFGGTVNWKNNKMLTVERRREVEQELEKAKKEIPEYHRRSEAAEQEKVRVLQELDSTKRLIEELKLNLERTQIQERQARQDSELAKLRVEEMEQGVAEVSSFAARAQLEVAKARYAAAVTELKSVRKDLEELRTGYRSAITDKDEAVKKSEEALAESKQVEKSVEYLTFELLSTKESLETIHNNAHMEEAERDQDYVNQKILAAKDVKSKLSKASSLLNDLKTELNGYMGDVDTGNKEKSTLHEMQEAVASAKKELEEVKLRIEKTTAEVNSLKLAATSLRSEIEQEKSSLASLRQRESGQIPELPKKLEQAAKEANQANLLAQAAREALQRVKLEAEQARVSAITMQSRLAAAQKEIQAARASERLAIAAIKALAESESARSNNEANSSDGMTTLSVEDYYQLSKQVYEAEEQANTRVAAANHEIEIAKESELKALEKLSELNKEMADRRESLKIAIDKAEKARDGKLGVEEEIGKWNAEQEQRKKVGGIGIGQRSHSASNLVQQTSSPKGGGKKKKKKRTTLYSNSLAINCKNSRN